MKTIGTEPMNGSSIFQDDEKQEGDELQHHRLLVYYLNYQFPYFF